MTKNNRTNNHVRPYGEKKDVDTWIPFDGEIWNVPCTKGQTGKCSSKFGNFKKKGRQVFIVCPKCKYKTIKTGKGWTIEQIKERW